MAAVGTLSTISSMVIRDSDQPMQKDKALVRFIHLSPDAPAVDITLPNGTVIFNNMFHFQATDYIPLSPSTYTLQVRLANTPTVVLTVPNTLVEANSYYTIYAIGFAGKAPSLQALAVKDF